MGAIRIQLSLRCPPPWSLSHPPPATHPECPIFPDELQGPVKHQLLREALPDCNNHTDPSVFRSAAPIPECPAPPIECQFPEGWDLVPFVHFPAQGLAQEAAGGRHAVRSCRRINGQFLTDTTELSLCPATFVPLLCASVLQRTCRKCC